MSYLSEAIIAKLPKLPRLPKLQNVFKYQTKVKATLSKGIKYYLGENPYEAVISDLDQWRKDRKQKNFDLAQFGFDKTEMHDRLIKESVEQISKDVSRQDKINAEYNRLNTYIEAHKDPIVPVGPIGPTGTPGHSGYSGHHSSGSTGGRGGNGCSGYQSLTAEMYHNMGGFDPRKIYGLPDNTLEQE